MTRAKKVAVIMVNWNGLEHLKLSLPSLAKQSYMSHSVYLVDNGSSDGSIAYVKDNFPQVKLIESGRNLGFAGGNNLGMKEALADGADYLFLLNNDTEMKSNLIARLVDFMEGHPRVGIAQPKLLLLDHRERLDSGGSWLSKTGFLIHYGCEEKDGPQYDRPVQVLTVKGAAMIVRRETIDDIGLFDEDFFAYFEETDLCWRAWLRGWRVYFAPVSDVYHKIGGSTKKIGSPTINFHSFKNRIMSLIKNLEGTNLVWILPLHLILVLGFSVIYFAALRGRSGLAIYRAIGWNIVHLPSTWRKRHAIQSSREINDRRLFKIIVKPIDWAETFDFARRYFIGEKKSDLIAAGKWKGRQ